MRRIPHVRAGDPITADLFNEVSERLERFANLSTSNPYIRLWDGPYGKSIALALPQQTWALLSGSSSPYSFTEVRDGPGGTWVSMPNGDSGTSNVYEINGKPGLAGKVVPITWTAAGDWRFQWVGYGCTADASHICACGCSHQIPKEWFFSDTNGSHTLTYSSVGTGGIWTGSYTMVGVPLSTCNNGHCQPDDITGNLIVNYRLTLNCTTGIWTFSITWQVCACNPLNGDPVVAYWAAPLSGNDFSQTDTYPFDCNDLSMLEFVIPTDEDGMPTPGGGGTISVVP